MKLIACLTVALLAPIAALADFDTARLDRAIAGIAKDAGRGRLGVAVKDLRSGRTWSYRGDEPFPMQSVYKVPIAVAALKEVDRGALSLDQAVTVKSADLAMQWSPIAKEVGRGQKTYTLRALIEGMVGASDNTASDVVMRLAGGPRAVQAAIDAAGIAGLRVDRYEREFQPELLGLPPFKPGEPVDEAAYGAAAAALPEDRKRKALEAYLADPRDTATPRAAVAFLSALDAGKLLSPGSTAFLIDVMVKTPTGAKRLKAGLPAGSVLAHKTGSSGEPLGIGAATNDIGIATLPGGRKLAMAVFLAGSDRPAAQREEVHARVARAIVESLPAH